MNKNPIVIVDDDPDDCEFIMDAFRKAGADNKFNCFQNVTDALAYLKSTTEKTFLIICDINMPKINGIQFKQAINDHAPINDQRIPFIFLTTSADITDIREAYRMCATGYFKKPDDIASFAKIARCIIDYWKNNELSEEI